MSNDQMYSDFDHQPNKEQFKDLFIYFYGLKYKTKLFGKWLKNCSESIQLPWFKDLMGQAEQARLLQKAAAEHGRLRASLKGRTAIVIGGSMAGLWTARVLVDHFDQVIILERDQLPAQPEPRPGVPQGHQVHLLLLRGLQIMQTLFPGLDSELKAAGAVPFDLTMDARARLSGQWLTPFPSGKIMLGCSRLLLETNIRRRLQQQPKVRFIEGVKVTGLLTDPEKQTVTGVTLQEQRRTGKVEPNLDALTATFVVDASGRTSATPQWLAEIGYDAPQETLVNSYAGYASRRYKRPAHHPADWQMLGILPLPPHERRGGLIIPEEDGRWMVTLSGAMKDYPPTDEPGFLAFARSLAPEFYQAIKAAEPLAPIRGYRQTENRLRHYEKLTRWPGNFVVVGDALCAFNPIYAQGMTVAAMTALALGEHLAQANGDFADVAQKFQRAAARIIKPVWLMATRPDIQWSKASCSQPGWLTGWGHWYLNQLLATAMNSRYINETFLEVSHLLKPASALLAPGVLLRLGYHYLKGRQAIQDITHSFPDELISQESL